MVIPVRGMFGEGIIMRVQWVAPMFVDIKAFQAYVIVSKIIQGRQLTRELKNVPKWYAVKGSDTTMMTIAVSLPGQKKTTDDRPQFQISNYQFLKN